MLSRARLAHYERIARSTVNGRLNCKWDRRRSRRYYYLKKPDETKEHIIKEAPNAHVWRLQCKRFANEMVRILRHNIEAKQTLAHSLLPDCEADILEKIPCAYRPNAKFRPKPKRIPRTDREYGIRKDRPTAEIAQSENNYKREELNIQTSFGLFVRSKGELSIAELLYSLGIEFYYERGLTLDVLREEYDPEGNPTGR